MHKDKKYIQNRPIQAIIVSAPSGSGKTTLVRYLLNNKPDLVFSVSTSTRRQRNQSEQDGSHYYFLTVEDFKKKIYNEEFIEWQEVYPGKFYGTLHSEIHRIENMHKNIIFDIDVQGALNLKKYFGERALSVFVKPPSMAILKQRLIGRNTESDEDLAERLSKIKLEMAFENRFDKVLLNDDIEQSKRELIKLYDDFTKK